MGELEQLKVCGRAPPKEPSEEFLVRADRIALAALYHGLSRRDAGTARLILSLLSRSGVSEAMISVDQKTLDLLALDSGELYKDLQAAQEKAARENPPCV